MKITDHILCKKKNSLFSFEILPPLIGKNIKNTFFNLDRLMEFKPSFINVTYHNKEFIFLKQKNGLLKLKKISKRPGTISICATIIDKYQLDVVPHIICKNLNKKIVENILIDLNFLGINNILLLRGDNLKYGEKFFPKKNKYKYAYDLVKLVNNLNIKKNYPISDFCIGVAGYPEKHIESPNIESDLFFLKKKVESGANYIITQMFFDNKKYFSFVKKCRIEGIHIPIIPGIKPISSKKQLNSLPSKFYLSIPNELVKEIKKTKNKKNIYDIGIEWAIHQSKELKNYGTKIIHYYTMDKPENIYKILKYVF
ncbi:methylenetetrahydrofolate reductase [NAD(P)H] [Blattabacterium cuenoti]|uniref:methylenetetrahydrofolate reductase [NAD(P)H] n=1 Tax=Blattabacterium cuenoti TaxID=1653831 RepID=UPI00163CE05B|nr:methylenetetrahydrofolate reductase [NAD(P)H] [Blattabacterium cuenoti]